MRRMATNFSSNNFRRGGAETEPSSSSSASSGGHRRGGNPAECAPSCPANAHPPPSAPSPISPIQIAYEYEHLLLFPSPQRLLLQPHPIRRFHSISSPVSPSRRVSPSPGDSPRRTSFYFHQQQLLSKQEFDDSSIAAASAHSHSHLLAVPAIAIQRIHRRMSACGSGELWSMGGGGGAGSGRRKQKKQHPQLLRLTGQRAQSCTDFGNRLQQPPALPPPSSMAAAALSAKRIHESGWNDSPLFTPFQQTPQGSGGSAPATADAAIGSGAVSNSKGIVATNTHRPLQSSDSGSCSAPPSLSPELQRRKSSRFCCSFRRTLRRGGPKRERLLNESDSQPSNLSQTVGTSGSGGSKKDSTASAPIVRPSPEESQMLARAWSRKESRALILPDSKAALAHTESRERMAIGSDNVAAGSTGEKAAREKRESTFSLRRLSKAFFQAQEEQRIDLMNDWEIGGTQNPWVCPSDRHLQLRAQLKSGWSVRTASARSPTTSKQALLNGGAISEAEQEHIQQVLARAEAGRQNEQQRICKMMERLERLRARATGNGVTQCLLCQTEFGLLAAKSYAAMCSDCRKYVCQRNCGVETFDQKRREPIFLCKICSEYREVMWKKSGAWFYREVPLPSTSGSPRPASAMAGSTTMMVNGGPPVAPFLPPPGSPGGSLGSRPLQGSQTGPMPRRHFDFSAGNNDGTPTSTGGGHQSRAPDGVGRAAEHQQHQQKQNSHSQQQQRNRPPVPIPTEQQQRLKTTPRPRIIPSWVHEGLQQSSISVDDSDDGESASSSTSSSLEPAQFRKSLGAAKERALAVKQRAAAHILGTTNSSSGRMGGGRIGATMAPKGKSSVGSLGGAQGHAGTHQLQRVALGRPGRMTDSDESENEHGCCDDAVSRRSSPSTSPRHSLATPSSYGGDDIGNCTGGTQSGHQSGAGNVGSGGVGGSGRGECPGEQTMSDSRSVDSGVVQSDHSAQQQAIAGGVAAGGLASFTQTAPMPPIEQTPTPTYQQRLSTQTPSPVPPPIPPRSATIAAPPSAKSAVPSPNTAPPYGPHSLHYPTNGPGSRRPASAAAASSAAAIAAGRTRGSNGSAASSHESIAIGRLGGASRDPTRSGGPQELAGGDYRPAAVAALMGAGTPGSSLSLAPDGSRRSTQSNTMDACKEDHLMENGQEIEQDEEEMEGNSRDSPTFMSSPENDSKYHSSRHSPGMRSLCSRRDALVTSVLPLPATAGTADHHSSRHPPRHPCHQTLSLGLPGAAARRRGPPLVTPSVSVESAPSEESLPYALAVEEDNSKAAHHLSLVAPRRPHSASSLPTIDETSGTLGSIQFNLTYLAEEKQLIIHLIRAKNLKAMDKNGFSDPYVKLHLLPGNIKATKLTSRTIEKTLNPEWNEEMIYYGITEEEQARKSLRVTVLDRDRIGADFLGETRVALRKLPPGETKKFNLYLEHAMPMPASAEKGIGGQGGTDAPERGKCLLAVQYNIQQGSLFVTIKRCAELLGMDSTGFSDPYCKVSLTPLASKAHRQRTTIKKRTLNPEFNETIQFIVPFKDLPRKTLVIGVYDYDVGRHDDYIGGIVLSTAAPGERGRQWQQVIENPGKTFEHWHRLEVD